MSLRRVENPLILCYHAVSPDWPADLSVTPEGLREQLSYLLRKGYRPTTFVQAVSGEAPTNAMAVTFDDAFASVRERALPVLRELGILATVFVPTAYVDQSPPMVWPGIDRWVGGPHEGELTCMSWNDLRALLAEGWEIASHTRTHPRLTEIDDETLRSELVESREDCARELGTPALTLAYPYGTYDERVKAATKEAGYVAAAALEMKRPDPLSWPRVGVYSKDDLQRFRLKVSPLVRHLRSTTLMGRLRLQKS
jgi:peptidoglycan/xylan/chitin deacetylase (PgdA/CDA1 family)